MFKNDEICDWLKPVWQTKNNFQFVIESHTSIWNQEKRIASHYVNKSVNFGVPVLENLETNKINFLVNSFGAMTSTIFMDSKLNIVVLIYENHILLFQLSDGRKIKTIRNQASRIMFSVQIGFYFICVSLSNEITLINLKTKNFAKDTRLLAFENGTYAFDVSTSQNNINLFTSLLFFLIEFKSFGKSSFSKKNLCDYLLFRKLEVFVILEV